MKDRFVISGEAPNAVLEKYVAYGEEEVVVPSGIKVIGKNAFSLNDSIRKVVLPDGLEVIEENGFYACGDLQEIKLPSSLRRIGTVAFLGAGFKEIVIPNGVTEIEDYVFDDCRNLEKIALPDTLIRIGKYAFSDNVSLKRIFIPRSVISVDEYAFSRCRYLKIYCEGSVTDGFVDFKEIRKVEHTVTDYDSPRNFHTSSGGFDFHRYETEEEVHVKWNPENCPVYENVTREQFEEICKNG